MDSKGHIRFISLVVLILALIGAYQIYSWHKENVLKEKAYQIFNQVNEKVRTELKRKGYDVSKYDSQIKNLLKECNTPKKLKMLSLYLQGLYLGNKNRQIGIVKGEKQ